MSRFRFAVMPLALLLVSCQRPNSRVVTSLNAAAELTGDIPFDPLQGRVITSALNPSDSTMSTLFGNVRAVDHARTKGGSDYPAGAVLAMVTWTKQEDARWFGANIPAKPKSAEFVTAVLAPEGGITYTYRNFEGSPLWESSMPATHASPRIAWLLSQRAAVMP